MKHLTVNENAPAIGAAETLIAAPIEAVWSLLTGFEQWPGWNRSVSKMAFKGELAVGTEFVWVAGGSRIVSRLEEVEAPCRIAWSGRTLGIRAIHIWELETVGGATRVRTRESFEGLAVRLFPRLMARMMDKVLALALADLKQGVEQVGAGVSDRERIFS